MRSSEYLRLTTEARADLVDLLQAASQGWGEEAINFYAELLIRDVLSHEIFADDRDYRDEIAQGIIECNSGQHVLFYRANENELTILRIVHARRDIKMLLGRL
jgi:plasmid stabilization system protein ParE